MKTHTAAAVFPVSDTDRSLKFYTEVLGFEEEFRFGDYAGVRHGVACIHLSGAKSGGDRKTRPLGSGNVYIFCDEVDEYYKAVVARGAKIDSELTDEPYGMRDFYCIDPDGNQIGFGKVFKEK